MINWWCCSHSSHHIYTSKIEGSNMTQFLIPLTESIICIMQRVLSDGYLNKWKLRKLLKICELRFGQQGYIAKNGNLLQIISLFIEQPHHSLWYMWDAYLWELKALTWSCTSFVLLPSLYACMHQIIWCSYCQIVFTSTDASAFGRFSLRVAKV